MDQVLREAVLARDRYRCVRCGESVMHRRYSVHHRKLRSKGGNDDPANLIVLCGSGTEGCHHLVHSKRREIGEPGGYLLHSTTSPAEMPVLYHGRGWLMLTPQGGACGQKEGT